MTILGLLSMYLLDQSELTDAKKCTLKCPHIIIYKII